MEEIIKTLLLEGIDEETIHRVLDVIEEEYEVVSEMDNPEKKHELIHNERVRRYKQAKQDYKNANLASYHLGSIKNPEIKGEYYGAPHELQQVTSRASANKRKAESKLKKADNLIKRHSHKVLGKSVTINNNKQGVTHRELQDWEKDLAKQGIYYG